MKYVATPHNQRGVASILTVIFLMIIISIITLGFLRIALQEGNQTLDDDMSKAAHAAAYSGVNDAKRAILYCATVAVGSAECDDLNRAECPGFVNTALATKLDIVYDAANGVTVGDPTLNERYTCVTIQSDTGDVSGDLEENGTTLIPLRGTTPFTQVRISWEKMSNNPVPPSLINGNPRHENTGVPSGTTWGAQWPALLRTSFIRYPTTGITIPDDATGDWATNANNLLNKAFFLYPLRTGISTLTPNIETASSGRKDINCANPLTEPGFQVGGKQRYDCQVTMTFDPSLPGTMYLQLAALYKSTNYAVELLDATGAVVPFDNVSPLIDSTGATGNVFRRVQVRVVFNSRQPMLPNAVDIGGSLCKNFRVTSTQINLGAVEDCTAPSP